MAPVQRSCSLLFATRFPRLKSNRPYTRILLNKLNVFDTEPVIFGVGVPMNTNGACAHVIAGLPSPPSQRTLVARFVVASRSADTTRFDQMAPMGYPTTFVCPAPITTPPTPP